MNLFVPKNNDQKVLNEFLNMPLNSSKEIMEKFLTLPNAKAYYGEGEKQNFVFVPKKNAIVTIVAHADTVFNSNEKLELLEDNGKVFSGNTLVGIGADDRAGCAICWLLKNEPVNILITDGEEIGLIGSAYLKNNFPKVLNEINKSKFVLQFDRKNGNEFKTYDINVTAEFKTLIQNHYGFVQTFGSGKTDIVNLCQSINGANLSVGYYNPHTADEYLVLNEWQNVLNKTRTLLKKWHIKATFNI